jgi:hypothetical protein
MDKKQQENIIKYGIGATIAYFLVAKPILQKFGIIKTDEEVLIQKELIKNESPFDTKLWKTKTGSIIITKAVTDDIINKIENAFTLISDNYESILAQFKRLSYKTQVSYLADKWREKKGSDLLYFLDNGGGLFPWDGLTKENLNNLVTYANNLK